MPTESKSQEESSSLYFNRHKTYGNPPGPQRRYFAPNGEGPSNGPCDSSALAFAIAHEADEAERDGQMVLCPMAFSHLRRDIDAKDLGLEDGQPAALEYFQFFAGVLLHEMLHLTNNAKCIIPPTIHVHQSALLAPE